MSDLNLLVEERRGVLDVFTTWLPRVAVALAFLSIGSSKFGAHSSWIRIFDQIGVGQWFRYVTGALQLSGAILVLIPRTFLAGILLLACTMVGAMLAWIFVLQHAGTAIIPFVVLIVLLAVGGQGLRDVGAGRRLEES